jgi:FG-GAP-like repeat
LPDADGDGHPVFGNPQIRTFPREINQFVDATSVAFSDLDGDGDLDAVVTNVAWSFLSNGEYGVTVLINRGDGVFDPPVEYAAGVEPTHVIVADFNGDGFADLAVANASGHTVSVLANNGGGTFATDVKFAVGEMPRSLVGADFDGDGDIDLASLNTVSSDVSILLNDGSGTFLPERRIAVGAVTQRISGITFPEPGPFLACGDLNGDGVADLAVPANGRVKLLFGDGNGGFSLAIQHASVPNGAYAVVMGDLDCDGDNDLATVGSSELGGEALSVLLNTGGGVFGPATTYSVATQPSPGALYEMFSLALGDLESDGDLDIALGYEGRQLVSIFRNNGDGSFMPKETSPVHPGPWFVAWADVNGDGATDLAVLATRTRSKLAILLNDGDGALITQEETPPYFSSIGSSFPWISPTSVAAADLDGDGDQDLAVTIRESQDPSAVVVLFNDGTGTFDPVVPYTLGPVGASSAEHVVIADLNNDGIPDLAVADAIVPGGWDKEGKVWILLGVGSGTFAPAVPYQFVGLYPMHVAAGDFDGDGDTDLAVWTEEPFPGNNTTRVDRRIVVMLNDGTGLFQIAAEYVIGNELWGLSLGAVVAGDFDSDGDLDLAATVAPRRLDGSLVVLINDGRGVFEAQPAIALAPHPQSLVVTDLDSDGNLDLAALHDHNHSLEVVQNEAYLTVLFGDGSASFPTLIEYVDPSTITFGLIDAVDIDGDGEPDLALPEVFGAVLIHLNRGNGNLAVGTHYGVGDLPTASAVADFDGDGRIDIVTSNLLSHNVTLLRNLGTPPCYADCDTSTGVGVLDMADFLCFQSAFTNADPYACDCDTTTGPLVCDIFDFLCFQSAFVSGCP